MPGQQVGTSALSLYLSDIRTQRTLSKDEELETGRRISSGMHECRADLVVSNLGFVVKIAREYQNMGVPLDDLLNEGNLGLIHAASRYDHQRGVRFITYAAFWVRKAILKALADQASLIRVPSYQRRKSPTPAPYCRPVPLDDTARADGRARLIDILIDHRAKTPEHDLGQREEIAHLSRVLRGLGERQRRVIDMRYGLAGERVLTLKEIGDQLGLSKERVRQIETEALARLRTLLATSREPAGVRLRS